MLAWEVLPGDTGGARAAAHACPSCTCPAQDCATVPITVAAVAVLCRGPGGTEPLGAMQERTVPSGWAPVG